MSARSNHEKAVNTIAVLAAQQGANLKDPAAFWRELVRLFTRWAELEGR